MGMGFAPTWLRLVTPPPASHVHFNHWVTVCFDRRLRFSSDADIVRLTNARIIIIH